MTKKILIYLTILLMLLSCFAPALAEEVETTKFVPPKLPKDAEKYNPDKPEELNPDQLYAKSVILIEAETGEVIFEKNADEAMYPASTTKILTVLLGLQHGDMEQTVTITAEDLQVEADSSLIPLAEGETIQFKDLLYATMLRSGNEGANAIARTVAGNVNDFVSMMNQSAANMGCTNTNFQNPHGLHNDMHYTTARDMAKIAREAMKNSDFRQIVATTAYTLPKSNLYKKKNLGSRIAEFLVQSEKNQFYYPYGNGIKTGFHNLAGHCFVGSAEMLGVKLLSVVFYSSGSGRWTDTIKLMNYGFAQVVCETPKSLYELDPIIIETSGFSTKDENLGKLELLLVPESGTEELKIISSKNKIDLLSRNFINSSLVEYVRDFRAPISQGELMGRLTYISPQSGKSASYSLIASRAIEERTDLPLTLSQIENKALSDNNIFPKFTIELFVYWLIPPVTFYIVLTIIINIMGKIKGKNINKRLPRNNKRRYK